MGQPNINTVEEMTRAIEDMELVLNKLKSDLALIKQLAGREEARDYSGVSYRHRKHRKVTLARSVSN